VKRLSLVLVGLAAVGIGCQSEPAADPQVPSPSSQSAAEPQVDRALAAAPVDSPAVPMTFVSLKVPNMV